MSRPTRPSASDLFWSDRVAQIEKSTGKRYMVPMQALAMEAERAVIAAAFVK
jgi:hypothetical protein